MTSLNINQRADTEPVDVIYIAGYGRSGSTLLDLMLGGIEGFESLGEMKYLWSRGCEENLLCATGEKFWDCSLWASVIRDTVGPRQSRELAVCRRHQARLDSVLRFPAAFLRPERVAAGHEVYVDVLSRLYPAIQQRLAARVLVDSSKHPVYALLLAQVPGIRLHVVHLTRDCRGVAHSWQRRKLRPEIHWTRRNMPRYSVTRTALKWMLHNRLAEQLRECGQHYVRLRYEDLVAEPGRCLGRTLSELELETPATVAEIDRLKLEPVVRRHGSYSVSGNPIRFERGDIPIRYDNLWQHEMRRSSAVLADLIARPLQRRYGYMAAQAPASRSAAENPAVKSNLAAASKPTTL